MTNGELDELVKVYDDAWAKVSGGNIDDARRAVLAAVAEHVRKGASAPPPERYDDVEVGKVYTMHAGEWRALDITVRNRIVRVVNTIVGRRPEPTKKDELTDDEVGEIADEFSDYEGSRIGYWSSWDGATRLHMVRTVNAALARHSVPFVRELSDGELAVIHIKFYGGANWDALPEELKAKAIAYARACVRAAVTLPEGWSHAAQLVDGAGTIGWEESADNPISVALMLVDGPGAVHTVFIPDPKPKTQPETINILGYEFFVSDLREALTDKQLRDTLRAALGEVENG